MIPGAQISICIPAYKRADFLKRLLDSIGLQTFRNFEVIVTDDSPDESVRQLCVEYQSQFPLHYYRNQRQLGTPENWNEAVRRSRGEWIKIMHDDDWFAGPQSLAEFALAADAHPESNFIFCAYCDIFLDEGRDRAVFVPKARYRAFLQNTSVLFARNIIGPPSVILYRRAPSIEFDPKIKWVVDIDFYMRYLKTRQPAYIHRVLINVGVGEMQVTQDCRKPEVEIPESLYLLEKVGLHNLRNVVVYDAFWRLMRNFGVRSRQDIVSAGYNGPVPASVLSMITWQRQLPHGLWKFGPLSKAGMFLNYCMNYFKIRKAP